MQFTKLFCAGLLVTIIGCSSEDKKSEGGESQDGRINLTGFKNSVTKSGFNSKGQQISQIYKSAVQNLNSAKGRGSNLTSATGLNVLLNSSLATNRDGSSEEEQYVFVEGEELFDESLCRATANKAEDRCSYKHPKEGQVSCGEKNKKVVCIKGDLVTLEKRLDHVDDETDGQSTINSSEDDVEMNEESLQEIPSTSDEVVNLISHGQEDCDKSFENIKSIYLTQKKQLDLALTQLKNMQNKEEQLALSEQLGVEIKEVAEDNTAVGFEISSINQGGIDIVSRITGAANDDVVIVKNSTKYELKSSGFSGQYDTQFAADVKKELVDYKTIGNFEVKSSNGKSEKIQFNEFIGVTGGSVPSVTLKVSATGTEGSVEASVNIVMTDKDTIKLNGTSEIKGDGAQQSGEFGYNIKRLSSGKCTVEAAL